MIWLHSIITTLVLCSGDLVMSSMHRWIVMVEHLPVLNLNTSGTSSRNMILNVWLVVCLMLVVVIQGQLLVVLIWIGMVVISMLVGIQTHLQITQHHNLIPVLTMCLTDLLPILNMVVVVHNTATLKTICLPQQGVTMRDMTLNTRCGFTKDISQQSRTSLNCCLQVNGSSLILLCPTEMRVIQYVLMVRTHILMMS